MLGDIVVTLDTSEASELVLNYIPPFVAATGAQRVTLLSVVPRGDVEGQSVAADYLARRVEGLMGNWDPDQGAPPDIRAAVAANESHDVAGTVFDHAAKIRADVIMLSTRGWAGGEWWVVGSVAERIIKAAPLPVCVVRPGGGLRRSLSETISRILVPLDGSALAERSLTYARHFARTASAETTLLSVESDVYGHGVERYLRSVALRLGDDGAEATTVVRRGRVAQQIVAAAQELPVDMVVMSSHGRTGPGGGRFGGVADRVLHGCHVPMLIVPAAVRAVAV